MGDERLTDVCSAGDHVEQPVGQAGLDGELGEPQRRARSRGRGLEDDALPAASAGPAFQIAMISGKFHGVMPATTPTGRRVMIEV